MSDLWFVFALGAFVGVVAGIYAHIAYLESMRIARWIVRVLRRLYAWHQARLDRAQKVGSDWEDRHRALKQLEEFVKAENQWWYTTGFRTYEDFSDVRPVRR